MQSLRVTPKAPRAFTSSGRRSAVKCQASIVEKAKATAAAVILSAGLAVAPAFASVDLSLANGATVSSPVHIDFTVSGLTVKPAAEGLQEGTGHHHLLVDVAAPAAGEAIPFDDAHKHFGKGQTGVDLELAPGKHTLTLQFANALHESYGPAYAKTITVNVK
ncbi:hypothetical protein CHLRE_01g016900v5 [Chlamydomonas reinhardtii]|uniref:Uncharacterized protein n=1 Tax=Chlamydomonas reinhardtii TaxID=3055 RepID=A8HPM8_CHLRE|nr:uncharacterized protein CHLRE_01g016900v5 [Chlamydomonas reinhardtii]PNW88160.1 hypothetical protein CHLRE_01g016900v5 [Chlamydomonas reinhardtii]|eukprot:XP_001689925.1 predicted protein [Chlamydomonas reinhardtii]